MSHQTANRLATFAVVALLGIAIAVICLFGTMTPQPEPDPEPVPVQYPVGTVLRGA